MLGRRRDDRTRGIRIAERVGPPALSCSRRPASSRFVRRSRLMKGRLPHLARNHPMKLNSLGDLFLEQLKDVYNAEKQLVKALPKMAKAASAPELRLAFQDHLAVTKEQVGRLERIFEELGSSTGRKKCR